MADNDSEHVRLCVENARLVVLLDIHGITWRTSEHEPVSGATTQFTTDAKVALFCNLFCSRTDVCPAHWESKVGKTRYSPTSGERAYDEKPRVKCTDCGRRVLMLMVN